MSFAAILGASRRCVRHPDRATVYVYDGFWPTRGRGACREFAVRRAGYAGRLATGVTTGTAVVRLWRGRRRPDFDPSRRRRGSLRVVRRSGAALTPAGPALTLESVPQ